MQVFYWLPPCCLRVYFWFLLPAARILKPLPPVARRNRCGVRFLWFLEPMAPPAVLLRETNVPKTLSHSSFSPFLGKNALGTRVLSYLEPSTPFLRIQDNFISCLLCKSRDWRLWILLFRMLAVCWIWCGCCVLLKHSGESGLLLP